MQNTILKLYEFYERYHNTKEKMAWLGISFYAVFTLGIIRIFTMKDLSIDSWLLWVSIGVLTVVMGCILWFLCFHYKKKRCAAKIVDDLEDFLSKKNSNSEKGLIKIIRIRSGQPVIYTNHIVRGFKGKSPLGNHPNIQCPDSIGSAIFDMTKPVTGFTAPTPIDVPKNQGYSLLKPGVEIEDRSKIPTVYGDFADLTKYPMPKGYEDVVMFINDDSKEFTFTSLTIPEEEFLYFQLKDPKVLSETLLWMPHGGRYYTPFNGRVTGVIGVEEVTGNFFYGIQPSVQNNPILERGFNTFCEIDTHKPFEVKLISGLIPVGKGFKGVKDIVKKDSTTVFIIGRGGEEIEVPCNVDFLKG